MFGQMLAHRHMNILWKGFKKKMSWKTCRRGLPKGVFVFSSHSDFVHHNQIFMAGSYTQTCTVKKAKYLISKFSISSVQNYFRLLLWLSVWGVRMLKCACTTVHAVKMQWIFPECSLFDHRGRDLLSSCREGDYPWATASAQQLNGFWHIICSAQACGVGAWLLSYLCGP